jgi:hypothetical protein
MEDMVAIYSPEVREICAHMTDTERTEASRRGAYYGLWVFATFAGPLAFLCTSGNRVLIFIGAVLITVHVICIPIFLKMLKRFLCSTVWAIEQGFTTERIRLFAFRR